MIDRQIGAKILRSASQFPIITVTGPRQSGKTTLIKSLFPDLPYFSMETPDVRAQVEANPRELFSRYGHRLVIDEVQRVPQLLSYIQTIVDEDEKALFVLSGSQNFLMMEQVSQSLAGRTALFYLLPLGHKELMSSQFLQEIFEEQILYGGYPRIYARSLEPQDFYPAYLETYVQRDVRQLSNIGNLNLFNQFLSVCAGHIGHELNYSRLANTVGISVGSVKNWISVLEASFILYRLPPYFRNFNKRVTKAPRLYFYDTGLACSLLKIRNIEAVQNYFQRGELFENMVINEIMKAYFNEGLRPPLYYWRDHNQREIDLLIDKGGELIPIEIKSGRTFNSSYFKNLDWFRKIAKMPVDTPMVIYGGDQDWELENGKLLGWKSLVEYDWANPSA